MNLNLDELSIDELGKLIKQAERKLEKKRMDAVKAAQAEIGKIARELGVSVDDLLQEKAARKKKATRGKVGRPRKTGVRKPAKIKYRNPANSAETWTGRGKRPIWLRNALENGASLESFEV